TYRPSLFVAMLRLSQLRRCDLYNALGVRPGASQNELREAYLRRAKQYHPDVSGSGCASFQRVQQAWETLRDPAQRRIYDNGLPKTAGYAGFNGHTGFNGHAGSTGKRHWYEVMREVQSNPDMRQFVGAGLQMKLLCQLGFILAAMLNLLLWAFAKQQRSRGSSVRPPSELDRALKSLGISLR
ncbi:Dnaja2, partial [Symbiodinium pilosum]